MKEDDYLNFILFSGDVTTWKDNLVQATPENIQEAREFVMNIHSQGSKNRGQSRHFLPLLSLPEQLFPSCPGAKTLLFQALQTLSGVEVGMGGPQA